MGSENTIYVLGSGAIGFPLAAYLAHAGRSVVAVRTSRGDIPRGAVTVTARSGDERVSASVETVSLAGLERLDGLIVLATKAYANGDLARELGARGARGPVVILQNGVGVERPFLEGGFPEVYRCVLYITSQAASAHEFTVRPVTASPIGVVRGDEAGLARCVEALHTPGFPFRAEARIEREVWKKAIINAVFNSVCPLLEVDNGVFARDEAALALAREVVGECVVLTDRLGLALGEGELLEQLLLISRRSDGQLISTLQDLRAGRPTEIESLNLEIARVGAALEPGLALPRVELLGRLVAAKAALGRVG
ncbi:MAG TPA: 2-dehydropantoate 2-reductase [Chloroflexaceae bacterium]|nr:2-dehydropantoate 2-reductase [Chloroflexaceae bacterium]